VGRPVVLSNGQLFVGLDESGLVHDFYYPYVGLENLTNARSSQHKIGVWVDHKFKWTDDGSWEIQTDYDENALVSSIKAHSKELEISLHFNDYIDHEFNGLIRHIDITNDSKQKRDVRLFMHQVFQISRGGRADTAMYVPDDNYVFDYKGRYCLLIGGKFTDGTKFDQYAVGSYDVEGKEGTFRDAEDGELSGNPVEHGGVDSVIRFQREIESKSTSTLDYWVLAGSSQYDVQALHATLSKADMINRLNHAHQHWNAWLGGGDVEKPPLNRRSLERSLLVIKAHCDERGSVLASGDSSIFNYGRDYYCYCWPRDAAYAIWPLIKLGHYTEAKAFFEFARDTMHKDGYLMHKYQPDRAIGSTWHPLVHGSNKELAIQEDETAGVIFMIAEYLKTSDDLTFVNNLFNNFIVPCANFLCSYIDEATGLPHASYDLWEEKFLTTTYTVSTVIGGLQAAAYIAREAESPADAVKWEKASDAIKEQLDKLYHEDGYFVKGYLLQSDGQLQYDNTLDISSLYGPMVYAGLEIDDPRLVSTAEHIEKQLTNVTPSGGVVRYEHDNYFLTKTKYTGNPWIVTTLWLAQYYIASGQLDKATELKDWALARELPSGILGEQYDPENAKSLGVTPLVWSHAELINIIIALNKAVQKPSA